MVANFGDGIIHQRAMSPWLPVMMMMVRLVIGLSLLIVSLRYISMEEKKAQGAKRDNEVLLQRQKPGASTVPYRVIDNPLKLLPEDW